MEKKLQKNIFYILRFIDSARFMASSLSNLVDNLSEGIQINKCKLGYDDKKCETCGIKFKYCDCFFEYTNFKDDLIEYKCLVCNNNCQIKSDKKLNVRYFNTYTFSNRDNNKFILLLQKDIYPHEYIDDWEKFNETSLPPKEDFYNDLNMAGFNDADYALTKRACKNFEITIHKQYIIVS